MMKKALVRYGNNLVVSFTAEDERVWNLKVGDIIYTKIEKEIDWNELKERVKRSDDKLKAEGKI
jgi:hypothetical protein